LAFIIGVNFWLFLVNAFQRTVRILLFC